MLLCQKKMGHAVTLPHTENQIAGRIPPAMLLFAAWISTIHPNKQLREHCPSFTVNCFRLHRLVAPPVEAF
ncbi:hypothetical protein CGZ80_26890 [Rhodopirellula sp. MGV]|nr:hypothetical protein CGZ80_26890 [Rhodopirellula sp. MGV]PNY38692.1 hypothetical protein C2E31_01890 [Rhodopirellula baltica]